MRLSALRGADPAWRCVTVLLALHAPFPGSHDWRDCGRRRSRAYYRPKGTRHPPPHFFTVPGVPPLQEATRWPGRNALVWLVATAVALTAAGLSAGETVVLHQGFDDYTGCTTRTIEGFQPVKGTDDGTFALRGSQATCRSSSPCPPSWATRSLARAVVRLSAQGPRAQHLPGDLLPRVTGSGRQPTIDEGTDYDNGRRAGAVRLRGLFAPAGEGWADFPFLPRGVPSGGKWISFNITR